VLQFLAVAHPSECHAVDLVEQREEGSQMPLVCRPFSLARVWSMFSIASQESTATRRACTCIGCAAVEDRGGTHTPGSRAPRAR
jgi:hypothetical protein